MPDSCMLCLCLGNLSTCAKRSDTKEADDPLSNKALASVIEPSGAYTINLQVMSKVVPEHNLTAVFETTVGDKS